MYIGKYVKKTKNVKKKYIDRMIYNRKEIKKKLTEELT